MSDRGGPWSVYDPVLASTSDRRKVARTRPDTGPPESWFPDDVLGRKGFEAVSFDFFVNWASGSMSSPVLCKVSARRAEGGVVGASIDSVRAALHSRSRRGEILFKFCSSRHLDPYWAVIPDWSNWSDPDSEILWCPIGGDGLPSEVVRMKLAGVRELIARETGQRFTPQKGLYWSTTSLEAVLSGTDTPWPGDADLVIVSRATGSPVAVVEFRKQTQDRELASRFEDYYPRPDGRRWDRLAILANHFQPAPPLLALHYSVLPGEPRVLVHQIEGTPGDLSESAAVAFEVPTDQVGREAFAEQFLGLL